ncbi:MAG: histidine kinase, dimerization and phosphoacceptor region [Friedmanniella sp.]|nr:histidine kinase, dimerization and phosphoacceptor region [Friedmanniella sp.]
MSRRWLLWSRYGPDALIVLAAASSAVGTAVHQDQQRPAGLPLWVEVSAIAGLVLALLLRHPLPFAAPAALWLFGAALSFLDGRLVVAQPGVFVAGVGAAFLLGNLPDLRQARIGLVILLVGAVIIVTNNPARTGGQLVFTPMLFVIGWLVGFALHSRAAQTEAAEERAARAERDREVLARVAVAEERGRIARELHDVVAHAVSVMVLQVGAVRHRMPASNAADREALKNAEQAGRTALAEMRRLLGALRQDGDELELLPHPGLDDLDTLVTDVQATGLAVQVRIEGDPFRLPPSLDLSAYRILQEGLTNTLKHARAHHADVRLRYGAAELQVEVRDDGQGPSTDDGLGHGLIGIRERVKIFGGDLSAGAASSGGFVLCARLPLDGALRQGVA